jgi:hypothetical protein
MDKYLPFFDNYPLSGNSRISKEPSISEKMLGLCVTLKAEKVPSYSRTCLGAAIVTITCFGGWWWTEIMYDLQVFTLSRSCIQYLPLLK